MGRRHLLQKSSSNTLCSNRHLLFGNDLPDAKCQLPQETISHRSYSWRAGDKGKKANRSYQQMRYTCKLLCQYVY